MNIPLPPEPPKSRLVCEWCGDVTNKPHDKLCRLLSFIFRIKH